MNFFKRYGLKKEFYLIDKFLFENKNPKNVLSKTQYLNYFITKSSFLSLISEIYSNIENTKDYKKDVCSKTLNEIYEEEMKKIDSFMLKNHHFYSKKINSILNENNYRKINLIYEKMKKEELMKHYFFKNVFLEMDSPSLTDFEKELLIESANKTIKELVNISSPE